MPPVSFNNALKLQKNSSSMLNGLISDVHGTCSKHKPETTIRKCNLVTLLKRELHRNYSFAGTKNHQPNRWKKFSLHSFNLAKMKIKDHAKDKKNFGRPSQRRWI